MHTFLHLHFKIKTNTYREKCDLIVFFNFSSFLCLWNRLHVLFCPPYPTHPPCSDVSKTSTKIVASSVDVPGRDLSDVCRPSDWLSFCFQRMNRVKESQVQPRASKAASIITNKRRLSRREREKQDENTMTSYATRNCPRRSRKGKHGLRDQRSLWTHL